MTGALRFFAAIWAFAFATSLAHASDEKNLHVWRAIDLNAAPYQIRGDKSPDEAFSIGALIYRGGLHLTSTEASFGGYSGVTVSPDGTQLLAVSDRSHWLAAALRYGPGGRLIDLENAFVMDVVSAEGEPLKGNAADAEAVFLQDADLFVGFERQNRIDVYRPNEMGGIVFHRNAATFNNDNIPFNKGIEAIAPLDDSRMIAFSEKAPSSNGGVKTWIVTANGGLTELFYKPAEAFSPTDATLLPGGDILVLERAYSNLLGPRARLARISAETISPGALLQGAELARFRTPLVIDNMEGLTLRETNDGKIFIYLVSDDNQNRRRQKTILLMFELVTFGL